MPTRHIIVIGASAGGFEAVQTLVAGLPKDLPASIFVVWHMSPEVRGILPYVLNKYNTLPASNGYDHEKIERGRIYVAPPDRHMIIEHGQIRIARGPKENRFRPAVDPLFRSAAYVYGPEVIGIILSGALDDGTAGLWMIKHYGGVAIVQDPSDAAVPSMPASALREVSVDYSMPVSEIPALLAGLCCEEIPSSKLTNISMEEKTKTEQELRVAKGDKLAAPEIRQFGQSTTLTCPECHGVLFAVRDGDITRYRCHTGHAFSSDSLLSAVTATIDEGLWNVIRNMEEGVMLLNNTGDLHSERNNPALASQYFQKASEISKRIQALKDILLVNEQLSRDQISEEES